MASRVARVVVALALVACLAPAATASARALPKIGIADQKPDMFSDGRFTSLGIGHARRLVPWDVLRYRAQRVELDGWMAGAAAHGIDPLITFGRSRARGGSRPSPQRLRREFRAFRTRYPGARTFATWNEVNYCRENVCRRAGLVAAYYRALRRECRRCTILAAELLDLPSMFGWMRSFRRELGYMPRLWGLHNYFEVNRLQTARLREMLRLMGPRGRLWLTETGGLVRRSKNGGRPISEGARHAARVTRFIFDRLVKRNRRIRRVYIYHWNAGPPSTNWDSALITYGGRARGAFWVLRRVLGFGPQ